jgi:hypothetical protein
MDVELLDERNGGRSTPVSTGYSPDWATGVVGGSSDMHAGRIVDMNPSPIRPGGRALVTVETLWPDGRGWTHLRPGDPVSLLEGPRVVGTGVVVRGAEQAPSRDIRER